MKIDQWINVYKSNGGLESLVFTTEREAQEECRDWAGPDSWTYIHTVHVYKAGEFTEADVLDLKEE